MPQEISKRRRSRRALIAVDFINPLDLSADPQFHERALAAAHRAARLAERFRRDGDPVIFANDHFGEWTRDFSALVEQCSTGRTPGARLAKVIAPQPSDFPILKPRHSAFFGSPLEFLLEELGARSLVITGIAADNCVLFTASDAYLRKYELWVPADCVVAERDADRHTALAHMQRVLKARTAPTSAAEE